MQTVDPGHEYLLDSLDGEQENRLVFVKREGEKYPGNVGSHPGTTMQEVLRALIYRATYVNKQTPCDDTTRAISYMEAALMEFEIRAARQHGRIVDFNTEDAVVGLNKCRYCGHINCFATCKSLSFREVIHYRG